MYRKEGNKRGVPRVGERRKQKESANDLIGPETNQLNARTEVVCFLFTFASSVLVSTSCYLQSIISKLTA